MSNRKYDDIINLPHHVSERHPRLSKASYAAQFSPFAALTGYDGIVSEAARVTDERVELGEISLPFKKINSGKQRLSVCPLR